MSEYQFVECPLLTQLESMKWTVIDQGPSIPKVPTKSLRTDFRQWMLKEVFLRTLRKINRTENVCHWQKKN